MIWICIICWIGLDWIDDCCFQIFGKGDYHCTILIGTNFLVVLASFFAPLFGWWENSGKEITSRNLDLRKKTCCFHSSSRLKWVSLLSRFEEGAEQFRIDVAQISNDTEGVHMVLSLWSSIIWSYWSKEAISWGNVHC